MINNIKGRWEIFRFKWNRSKLRWIVIGFLLISLWLAWNGDYGYVPSELCRAYPWITYSITIIPLLALIVELELISKKYKSTLDEIRGKYGFKK